jgi:hypothetical protein
MKSFVYASIDLWEGHCLFSLQLSDNGLLWSDMCWLTYQPWSLVWNSLMEALQLHHWDWYLHLLSSP